MLSRTRSSLSGCITSRTGRARSQYPLVSGFVCEPLERRMLLTAVFDPHFGPQTQTQDGSGDAKMQSPAINVIFWGSFWGPASSPQSEAAQFAISQILQSTYLNITNQYGADSSAMFLNDSVLDTSNPPASVGGDEINTVIQGQIGNTLPESDNSLRPPIYVVVTAPGTTSPGAIGFNLVSSSFDLPADLDHTAEAWVGTTADSSAIGFNLDQFTTTFSHEVAEIMTDHGQDGFEVKPPDAFVQTGLDTGKQIGDNEAESYTFRMSNGVMVQPLWSQADGAYVVDDGTTQTFEFHPNWGTNSTGKPIVKNFSLIVNGDQLGSNYDDLVDLATNANSGISVTFNGETLNFDRNYLKDITLNLKGGLNSVIMDNAGLPLGVGLTMNSASGQINLKGPEAATTWNITGADRGTFQPLSSSIYQFSDVGNIAGGAGTDDFIFGPDGRLSGNIDGLGNVSGTTNSIDFSAFTEQVDVNLQARTVTPIGGTFSSIQEFIGGSNALDTLIGPNSGGNWNLNSAGGGTVGGYTFSSFNNLTGGSGNDNFIFQTNGSVPGNIDGGGGANTLDYSALAGPVTVNFNTHTASDIGGTFANITNVVGSMSAADTIVGPDASWIINGADAGSVNGITFSSFENLVGNALTDTFAFKPGGSISGNIDGGGGVNTLDFSALTTPVTINFATHSVSGLIGGTFSNISNAIGGPGGFVVVGPNTATTWTITGVNVVSALGLTFTNTPSLTGGSADDTFVFLPGGRLDGKIDGGGGANTLDDSRLPTDVIVNLTTHNATAIGQGLFNVQKVIGGKANSLLVGDASANTLIGGTGRNFLIGGKGADSLTGGGGDNILIGDATIYDSNMPALLAIFAEWTRTDISFQKRISDLISNGGHGLNGSYTLGKKAILSDGFADSLAGGAGSNWFLVTNKEDVIAGGKTAGDRVTTL